MSKAEHTRAFIITAAAPVFNTKGYAETSLSDIMNATKLTKGSIYGNFADKQELAIAAYQYNVSVIETRISAAISQAVTAYDQLLAFANYYRTHCTDLFTQGGCPIMNAAVEADDYLEYLKPYVQQSLSDQIKRISKIIKSGQLRGEFKTDIKAGEYAAFMISLLEGSIMMAKILNKPALLYAGLDHMIRLAEKELKV